MSYFKVTTKKDVSDTKADFMATEFGIAQAAFQTLASRPDNDDVLLELVCNGGERELICNKAEFLSAQEAMRRQQMMQRGGLV